jgi:hypothetical protein
MKCADCMFWFFNDCDDEMEEGVTQECRRYPPQRGEIAGKLEFEWPLTNSAEWCGEFRPK